MREKVSLIRRVVRIVGRVLGSILAIVILYGLAGITGSLLPANSRATAPEDGVLIHVRTNGIHTGLVLPVVNEVFDWRELVRAGDLPDPRYATEHLWFGWGDRVFYMETPTWGDLTPGVALTALFGSDAALLHVDHVPPPVAGDRVRPIRVSRSQYRAIVEAIRADFTLDAAGRSQPVSGYGGSDVFYEAQGRYSAFDTCNEWTGALLRDAGVRIGQWTPFSFGVMWWFSGKG